MKKKKRWNWGNEVKLLANRESNLFKAQQNKKTSISITEKPNLSNQITIISSGDEAKSLFRCQKKKKKKKKSDQILKGKSLSNNTTEHMDMDMDIVNPQAMGIQFDDEIIMEILKRLPVQSILRFKCVLKSWNALISDPYFKMKHLNHANNDQNSKKLLMSRKCRMEYLFSFYRSSLSSVQVVEDENILDCPSTCEPMNSVLYCSCDGLVLLAVADDHDKHLLLWNPSMRESILLPYPQSQLELCVCGLAYDATSHDYKILAVDLNDIYCQILHIEILALKSGSWKRICNWPYSVRRAHWMVGCGMDSLAYVHGSFHWVGLSHCYTIASFNISNEKYNGEIPLLKQMLNTSKPNMTNRGVSVLEGMLCFYCAYRNHREGMFKFWVMKDDGVEESWTALLTVEGRSFSFFSAIPIYKYVDGEVLLRCIFDRSGGSINRTSRGTFAYGPRCSRIRKQGMVYAESLISPKSLI